MFGFFQRKHIPPPIDRRQSLAGIPVLNPGVRIDPGEERDIVVVKLQRGKGFWSRFQPAVMERTIKLDELGTYVLRQIDGRRPVLAIVDAFTARFKLNRRESELSTVTFLRSLAERRAISIIIK